MRSRFFSLSSTVLFCGSLAVTAHAQAPYLVKDLNAAGDGFGSPVGAAGDRLVFVGTDGSPDGHGIWSTDGTDSSTQVVAPGLVLDFQASVELPGALVGSLIHGADGLWRTDGTPAGTRKISPNPAGGLASPFYLQSATFGGLGAYYGDSTPPPSVLRPFVTDGTAEGTSVVPFPIGVAHVYFSGYNAISIDAFRGGFAFVEESPSNDGSVWLYDPSTHRTTSLATPGPGYFLTLRAVDERLFLSCGAGLCVTDGTASGTRLVSTLPGPALPFDAFQALDGRVYFQVSEQSGARLWRSDGTEAGTVPLASIAPVLDGTAFYGPAAVSGSVLYFAARSPATGRELWRTDGTASGTFLLKDIDPGPGSGLPGCAPACTTTLSFAPVPGGLIFWAGNAATGAELWKTDGTSAGTVPLPEIVPGPGTPLGGYLFRAGRRVYFSADDGVHGRELWAIELPAGAVSVEDAGAATEGDGADTTVTFTVRLQSAAAQPVTVSYTTVAGTALAGSDFVPKAGTLTFAPGEREALVEVTVVSDGAFERAESFGLAVTTTSGAPVADGKAIAVVLDDDGPRFAVAGASAVEGDSGLTNVPFAVTLSTEDGQPTTSPVVVRAEVAHGTAGAADFPPPPTPFPYPSPLPSVTFPAGTASGAILTLPVPILSDTIEEPNETFSLRLDAGNDAVLPDVAPIGVILDDDGVAANPPVEITHGSRIVADLAPPTGRTSDVDFYVLRHDLHASYEVVLDAISGDAAPITLERVVADGGVFQVGTATGTGTSVSLRFFGLGTSGEHLRVRSDACGTACGTDDVYRLRMYETTLSSPRINNLGSQATALVLQNTTDRTVSAVAAYWSEGGVLAGLQLVTMPPHGGAVVDTSTNVLQFAGSLTVAHDAPYGALVGKVVALDPATGLSFETPLSVKPR